MCVLLDCAISSCSKDDTNDPIEAGTQNAEAKKFIGKWHSSVLYGGTWIFDKDGTCKWLYEGSTSKGEWG